MADRKTARATQDVNAQRVAVRSTAWLDRGRGMSVKDRIHHRIVDARRMVSPVVNAHERCTPALNGDAGKGRQVERRASGCGKC